MNALERLLWSFEESDLEEITLAANRTAEGVTNGIIAPLGDDVWTSEQLVDALVGFGGSRHVEELSATPRQWTSRVVGLGVISVSATQKGDAVEARFRITKKNGKSVPPPPQPTRGPEPRVQKAPPPDAILTKPVAKPGAPPRHETRKVPLVAPPAGIAAPPAPAVEPFAPVVPVAPPAMARGGSPARRVDTPTQMQMPKPPSAFQEIELDEAPTVGAPLGLAVPSLPPLGSAPASPRPQAPAPIMAAPLAGVPSLPPLQIPAPTASPAVPAPAPVLFDLPPPPVVAPPAPPPPPLVLTTLLANARDAKASDLHIIAGRPPLYRVAGDLRGTGPIISPDNVERMVLPLVPDRLVSVLEEQGSCDFAVSDATHGRFRVNVSRQATGYKACLRLISRELPTVDSLRLPEGIGTAAHHHQGLIIFTGPTGHGKTTTMNAVVDLINRTTSHHIITVEDPVEHLHPKKSALMSQREVGTHTKSFATALKASLREDPDVIVVGELRDVETVRMAVSASETGHLVLGTMNTPNAARTLDRLIDLFPPADQPQVRLTLAASLRLIVSQRLVPAKDGAGMHAAFEVLPGSVPLAALIRDNKTFQIPSLQQRGKALGIVRLDDSLIKLVAEDRVSMEVAKSLAEAPQEVEAGVKAYKPAGR